MPSPMIMLLTRTKRRKEEKEEEEKKKELERFTREMHITTMIDSVYQITTIYSGREFQFIKRE